MPLVERGSGILDPFARLVTSRVDGDVVGACEEAAEHGLELIRREIRRRVDDLISARDVDPAALRLRFVRSGDRLRVVVTGPPLECQVEQSLAIRVVDGVHAGGRSFAQIDVDYCAVEA